MYVYGASLFYVFCSTCVWVCGNVCCVAEVVKDSVCWTWIVEVCCIFVMGMCWILCFLFVL